LKSKIRIAVVDDHPLVRRGILEIIAENNDFELAGEGGTADEAVKLATSEAPDILLLDIGIPGGGISAAEQIGKKQLPTRIVFLTVSDDRSTVTAALSTGAIGYVLKGVTAQELSSIIRKCHAGEKHINSDLSTKLLVESESAVRQDTSYRGPEWSTLTSRERQILELIGHGHSNAEIGISLKLAENTVKHYVTPLLQKLGARNRTEAALLANRDMKKHRSNGSG
jgi:two-component system, NarL family, nitrate/nitrite response regulator NarL